MLVDSTGIKIKVMSEAGYSEAMVGLSLSYGVDKERAEKVAPKLASKEYGHNKFLESICIWIDVTAPRYWWQEFDTYRVGVTKQSASTMHTIMKRPLTVDDFECKCITDELLKILNTAIAVKDMDRVKRLLPEGFLQRRVVCTNYKTMRNITRQRYNHTVRIWRKFIKEVYGNIQHKEFFRDLMGEEDLVPMDEVACYS